MAKILVVDDEIGIRELLQEILYEQGHSVDLASNVAEAREARLKERPDLVLLDIWMPDADGVSLLKEWSSQGLLDMPVIMMSGHATLDTAIEATRIGAADFLEKPITLNKLMTTVRQVLQRPIIRPGSVPVRRMQYETIPPQAQVHQQATPYHPDVIHSVTTAQMNHSQMLSTQAEDPTKTGYLGPLSLNKPLRTVRDEFERIYFEYHLEQENHSMTRVSERTGLERTHLYRKLRQLGVDSRKNRNS